VGFFRQFKAGHAEYRTFLSWLNHHRKLPSIRHIQIGF